MSLRRLVTVLLLAGVASCGVATPPGVASTPSPAAGRPVWPDEGPLTWAPRPTSDAITEDDLRTRLYAFAHDSMRGRRIGEPGNATGTEYIASEFRRLGLRPAGENGSYFQSLPFGAVRYDVATSRLAIGDSVLAARADWVPALPGGLYGFDRKVEVSDVPTVFAGRLGDTGVVLDPAMLRGKVAVFLPPPSTPRRQSLPPRCDSVPDRFGADAAIALEAAAAARRAAGQAAPASEGPVRDLRARRAGAVAVLVVGLDDLGPVAREASFAPRMTMQPPRLTSDGPAGASISAAAAARLFGRPVTQLAVGATGRRVSARWRYDWQPAGAPARNVIAVLPGADPARAEEYVLVGAHNDHVGTLRAPVDHDSLRAVNTVTRRQGANDPVCRPTPDQQRRIDSLIAHARSIRPARPDSIMNGADDDGSGTVVMLEIAERFAHERPARSILFISHQGEEAGLLGSSWFVEHPTVPLQQIVAAHNMDMVGKGGVAQVKFGGPNSLQILGARRLSREFGDIIDSVNANTTQPMALDRSWDVPANPLNRFCRSDQVSYVLKDIPVAYFSLGYAQDYHQPTDEPQYVDYRHAARVGRFIHDVMAAVADRPQRPAIGGADPSYPSCRR